MIKNHSLATVINALSDITKGRIISVTDGSLREEIINMYSLGDQEIMEKIIFEDRPISYGLFVLFFEKKYPKFKIKCITKKFYSCYSDNNNLKKVTIETLNEKIIESELIKDYIVVVTLSRVDNKVELYELFKEKDCDDLLEKISVL